MDKIILFLEVAEYELLHEALDDAIRLTKNYKDFHKQFQDYKKLQRDIQMQIKRTNEIRTVAENLKDDILKELNEDDLDVQKRIIELIEKKLIHFRDRCPVSKMEPDTV